MPQTLPKVSPRLKALFEKGLIERLPVTFSSYCVEQMKDWDLLFPAEQNYFERLFTLLDRFPARDLDELFGPMRQAEARMGVDGTWSRREFTLQQVDFLNRNPHYPEWRAAVSEIFSKLDPVLDAEVARRGHARLVIVSAPSELPVSPDRMWTRLETGGVRISIEPPERVEDHLALLLTGAPRNAGAPSIADLWADARKDVPYDAWFIEAAGSLGSLGVRAPGVVRLSYGRLETYRKRLMTSVNQMVKTEEIRGPRELSARLKQMKILAAEGEFASDGILSEFARSVLLNGNGTLLINNTFVEWAAMQAVRRARPSIVVASFGIRNKVKPFSSLLIYADQDAVNPISSQMDTLGSYVDLEIFYQYLWQEFEKYPEYRSNTAYLFVLEGAEEMLCIAPSDFPVQPAAEPLKLANVFERLKDWVKV